jgi:hypothetical protein
MDRLLAQWSNSEHCYLYPRWPSKMPVCGSWIMPQSATEVSSGAHPISLSSPPFRPIVPDGEKHHNETE